ncbi:xylulokinase [Paraburkholderia sp. HD33-4]|uniref:xylulokinase n=1 Tax=Paraburkholderia sp. HD33-4 TaxID=2883242 RepID=UPI001EFF561C|nr:FGGY family carbohydrate kinase [Paraburkholderia sp. HD33-4]
MDRASEAFVLGLDLGSSSCKVCALDVSGRILGTETESYPTVFPQPSWAEQDPSHWIAALGKASKKLVSSLGLMGKNARGLAITSAAHIAVLLDSEKKVLRNAILWSDQRSAREAKEIADNAGDEVLRLSNNWPTSTWSLAHLAWLRKKEPQVMRETRYVLLSKDYIGFLLTGRMVTDPSAAVSAMLMDVDHGTWSKQLCDLIDLDVSVLPEIVPTGDEIGTITNWGAQILGISEKARVFNGSMDSTAETFAAGVRTSSQFVIRLASAGGIHVIADPALARRNLISYPYCDGPFWLSQAGTNTCASAVAWARRSLTSEKEIPDFNEWSVLAAKSSPGSSGVMFHPYLSGERCPYWDGELRASFTGLSLHSTKSDMARAVYEGTAYSLRDAARVLEAEGVHLDEVKIVGGGAHSDLWTQTVANVFDCPVTPISHADSSAGAALYSLVGLGLFEGFAEVPHDVLTSKVDTRVLPNASLKSFFQDEFERYRFAQQHISAVAHFIRRQP